MDNFSHAGIIIRQIILLPSGLTIHYTADKLLNVLEFDAINTCEQLMEEGIIMGYNNINGEFNIKNYQSNFSPLLIFVKKFKITIATAQTIVRKHYSRQKLLMIHPN